MIYAELVAIEGLNWAYIARVWFTSRTGRLWVLAYDQLRDVHPVLVERERVEKVETSCAADYTMPVWAQKVA